MARVRLIVAGTFIAGYLGFLSWGIVAHALKFGICGNTISYFAVWDMFCGWTAWDQRTHVIAEGASGKFYDVTEPWGEFQPFGNVGRIHYDHSNHMLSRHIDNVLRHSQHEDIDRVYVVQEVWPKQYNLPPELYARYFDREADKRPYFHLRAVCSARGNPIQVNPSWHAQQYLNSVYDNPRLREQSRRADSLYSTLYTPNTSRGGLLNSQSAAGLTTN